MWDPLDIMRATHHNQNNIVQYWRKKKGKQRIKKRIKRKMIKEEQFNRKGTVDPGV